MSVCVGGAARCCRTEQSLPVLDGDRINMNEKYVVLVEGAFRAGGMQHMYVASLLIIVSAVEPHAFMYSQFFTILTFTHSLSLSTHSSSF